MKNKKKPCFYKINKGGYLLIVVFAVATLLGSDIWPPLGWFFFFLTALCVAFFRDPDRVTPVNDRFILSPADGTVEKIETVYPPEELGNLKKELRVRISIFLNILDVHINRSPIFGKVEQIKYIKGKFLHAASDKASKCNERNIMLIKIKSGQNVICTQIAGLVARRIVCNLKHGQMVLAGERYGLIKFGSRMDVYLPKGEVAKVFEGQRVVGGETVLSILGDRSALGNCVVR